MQIEGTETPTALTPNTTGDSTTSPQADNSTVSRDITFEPVLITGTTSGESTTNSTPVSLINNGEANSAGTSNPTVINIQEPFEVNVPISQSSRSETTSPNGQDTPGNSSGSNSSTSQNNRGNSASPQVQTATSVPSFTPFDSSLAGAPKSSLTSATQSNQPEGQNQKTQSERANYDRPDWLNDPFSPHNPALKNFQFNNKPPHTPTTATKVKKKKGESRKKTDQGPVNVDGLQIMIDGKLVPLQDFGKPPENETEEERAKREHDEVVQKIEVFHKLNPKSPIPLTEEDLLKILKYVTYEFKKNPQSNQLADSLFVNRLCDQGPDGGNLPYNYDILDNVGGNAPGEYDGGTINYILQGIVSAHNKESIETLEAKILAYNNAMKPAQLLINKIYPDGFPFVGKYENNEVLLNFAHFGYDFYRVNF